MKGLEFAFVARAGRKYAAATLILCACVSCHEVRHDQSPGGVSIFPIRSIPVEPPEEIVNALFPEAEQLEDNESVRRQTYSIQEDGGFTFTRTVERDRAVLGLKTKILDPETAVERGIKPFEGIVVNCSRKNSAAAKAGVVDGDVLLKFRGELIHSPEQLKHLVRERSKPGESVELELLRDGKPVSVQTTLDSEKEIVGSQTYHRRLRLLDDRDRTGMVLLEVPEELRPLVHTPRAAGEPFGLQVVEMVPGTPAFFSELEVGDTIVRVGERTVETFEDYSEAVASFNIGDDLPFEVRGERDKKPQSQRSDKEASPRLGTVSLSGVRGGQKLEPFFGDGPRKRSIPTDVQLDDDALARGSYNILTLVGRAYGPNRSIFKILGGILFEHDTQHGMASRKETITRCHAILNLFSYESRPGRTTVRIAWILPVWVSG